jgi:hypothetical protein
MYLYITVGTVDPQRKTTSGKGLFCFPLERVGEREKERKKKRKKENHIRWEWGGIIEAQVPPFFRHMERIIHSIV